MGSCFRGMLLKRKNSYDITDPYSHTYSTRESYHSTVGDTNDLRYVYDGTRWTNEPVVQGGQQPDAVAVNGTAESLSRTPQIIPSLDKESHVSDDVTKPANTSGDVGDYQGVDLEYEADSLTGTWDSRPNHEAHEEMKVRASMILEEAGSNDSLSSVGNHKPGNSIKQTGTAHRNGEHAGRHETHLLENGVDVSSEPDSGERTASEGDGDDVQEPTTPEVRQHEPWRPIPTGAYSVRFDVPDRVDSDGEERTISRASLEDVDEEDENGANGTQYNK